VNTLEVRLRDALAAEAAMWPAPESASAEARPRFSKRVIAVAVASLALFSIAATWLMTREVTDPTVVVCYQEVSLNSDRAGADSGGDLEVDLCADLWEDGILVNEGVVPAGQVPPFVGCVTDQGVLAVFPTDDDSACSRLGLDVPDPGSMTEGRQSRDLQLRLIEYFDAQDCQPISAAKDNIRKILDDNGFDDWEIVTAPGRPDRPCASLAFDGAAKTVRLVPIPRLGG
jgi:hypothetical protein